MDWTFTPPVGQVPTVAWYTVVDQVVGPHQPVQALAGGVATIVSRVLPWQLFMLTSDDRWAAVSGIVVNPPPSCV